MEVSSQFNAPATLLPGKRPQLNQIGGQVSPRARLDTVAKTKNPFLAPAENQTHPAHGLVTILTEIPQLPKKFFYNKI
jgi:hypothetical protein